MAGSWNKYCRHRDFSVSDTGLTVSLGERSQKVVVTETADSYVLISIVLAKKRVSESVDLPHAIWTRNRDTSLVGFRIDNKDRLVAEAWLPKLGLTTEEFRLYARTVAEESDRFEFQMTGEDSE